MAKGSVVAGGVGEATGVVTVAVGEGEAMGVGVKMGEGVAMRAGVGGGVGRGSGERVAVGDAATVGVRFPGVASESSPQETSRRIAERPTVSPGRVIRHVFRKTTLIYFTHMVMVLGLVPPQQVKSRFHKRACQKNKREGEPPLEGFGNEEEPAMLMRIRNVQPYPLYLD